MENNVLVVDIKGYKAELPILPLPSGIKIAFFNLHGNQELTEHCGKEIAKLLSDCDVLVTAESKGLQLTTWRRANSTCIIMRWRARAKSCICRTA